MIDKCLDILQSNFQALLGVDFWCWGEFPGMTKSITCLKSFVSFAFIVYHIHDTVLQLSLYSQLLPWGCSVLPRKEAIFLPLESELNHLHFFVQ